MTRKTKVWVESIVNLIRLGLLRLKTIYFGGRSIHRSIAFDDVDNRFNTETNKAVDVPSDTDSNVDQSGFDDVDDPSDNEASSLHSNENGNSCAMIPFRTKHTQQK